MGCVGLVDTGNAQAIYGGGATFPAPVYRYLFDCWHTPVDGNPPAGGPTGFLAPFPIAPACPNPAGNASGVMAQILYAPVGSGGGKRAIKNHDCSSAATGLGTPAAANAVPYVSSQLPAYGYPSCHFAGSDDTWNAADAADWVTKGNPAKYGLLLQLPAFAGSVSIPFNGNDGTGAPLNIVNPTPAGGSSGLNLSRKALCGIFSGHITQWSNPTLTALNGGVPLGAGPITVVHRSDGSGTTFVFAQAMFAQCIGEFGPNSESDPTIASWAFPWIRPERRGRAVPGCNLPRRQCAELGGSRHQPVRRRRSRRSPAPSPPAAATRASSPRSSRPTAQSATRPLTSRSRSFPPVRRTPTCSLSTTSTTRPACSSRRRTPLRRRRLRPPSRASTVPRASIR